MLPQRRDLRTILLLISMLSYGSCMSIFLIFSLRGLQTWVVDGQRSQRKQLLASAVEYAGDVLDMGDAGRLEAVFRPWIMSLEDIAYFAVLREDGQVISASHDDWVDKPFEVKKIARLGSTPTIEKTQVFFGGTHSQELYFNHGFSASDGRSIEQVSAPLNRREIAVGHLIVGFDNQTLRGYHITVLLVAVASFLIFFLLASLILGRLLTPISRFIDSSVNDLSRLPKGMGKAELLAAVESMDFKQHHHGIDEFSRLSSALHRFKHTLEESLQEIRELTHEKVEMLRFKAVSDSAQMIAHDIKKPFAMMRTLLQVHDHNRNTFDSLINQSRPSLEQAMTAGETLVQNLYEIGQADLINLAPTSMDALVQPSLRLNKMLLTKVQSVAIDWQHQSPVYVDASKIIRVVENILGNAIRAVNPAGSIWFSSTEQKNPQLFAESSGTEQMKFSSETESLPPDSLPERSSSVPKNVRGWVRLTIGNSGSYIAPERRSAIFNAFVTGGGSDSWGLGLAIAKRFVEMHGGEIGCSSDDRGTEFFFTLPIA